MIRKSNSHRHQTLPLFDPPTGATGGLLDLDAVGETAGEVGEVGDDADPPPALG